MEQSLKSGNEILEDFFNEIATLENVDDKIITSLVALYKNDKLTEKNIINALSELRGKS
jgi:hypothetical protein